MPPGLLLDTHVLHWWWCSPALLSRRVRERLRDGDQAVVVSAASWLELSVALHLPDAGVADLLRRFPESLAEDGFSFLALQRCHLQRAGRLRGPSTGWASWIDRLLVAQAQQDNLQLISLDPALEALGEPLLW